MVLVTHRGSSGVVIPAVACAGTQSALLPHHSALLMGSGASSARAEPTRGGELELVLQQIESIPCGRDLLRLANMRVRHDRMFLECFPDQRVRELIEGFSAPNLLLTASGHLDPDQRIRSVDSHFIRVSQYANARSSYLSRISPFFTADVLASLDDELDQPNSSEARHLDFVEAAVERLPNSQISSLQSKFGEHVFQLHRGAPKGLKAQLEADGTLSLMNVAVRLGTLVVRQRFEHTAQGGSNEALPGASQMWPQIVTRTDQLYAACEGALPIYQSVLQALLHTHKIPADHLEMGALKDPVRAAPFPKLAPAEHCRARSHGCLFFRRCASRRRRNITSPSSMIGTSPRSYLKRASWM